MKQKIILASDFGRDFLWGVAIAAQQNEGARNVGGRSDSIWDAFADKKSKIKNNHRIGDACDFFHLYRQDIDLCSHLGFNTFRFSLSWSRILPDGVGMPNAEGIRYYNDVINYCLQKNIRPFATLYHWDLPNILELEGGWTSHRMLDWFSHYTETCARHFGDRVKDWIVLNEPAGYTTLGYMLGLHAPGRKGVNNYFPAIHNTLLCQAQGGRILREHVVDARIGTTFSCSHIFSNTDKPEDIKAAQKVDAIMNRMFIEPLLGMGYPKISGFKFLEKLEIHNLAWRYKELMRFDYDFIGLQNYFPLTVKHNPIIPYLSASEVKPQERKVPHTSMGWEVNSRAFGLIIRQFAQYPNIPRLIITENGASFKDTMVDNKINDIKRIQYYRNHLTELLQLKKEDLPIDGYFAWTLTDNFEWNYGYTPKFGLVHVNRETQERTIKKSGHWFKTFLHT
ncbi:MAG: family 1 glycosylhydrolase [Chitinophagaceae bacterium]